MKTTHTTDRRYKSRPQSYYKARQQPLGQNLITAVSFLFIAAIAAYSLVGAIS